MENIRLESEGRECVDESVSNAVNVVFTIAMP